MPVPTPAKCTPMRASWPVVCNACVTNVPAMTNTPALAMPLAKRSASHVMLASLQAMAPVLITLATRQMRSKRRLSMRAGMTVVAIAPMR